MSFVRGPSGAPLAGSRPDTCPRPCGVGKCPRQLGGSVERCASIRPPRQSTPSAGAPVACDLHPILAALADIPRKLRLLWIVNEKSKEPLRFGLDALHLRGLRPLWLPPPERGLQPDSPGPPCCARPRSFAPRCDASVSVLRPGPLLHRGQTPEVVRRRRAGLRPPPQTGPWGALKTATAKACGGPTPTRFDLPFCSGAAPPILRWRFGGLRLDALPPSPQATGGPTPSCLRARCPRPLLRFGRATPPDRLLAVLAPPGPGVRSGSLGSAAPPPLPRGPPLWLFRS
ncbi:hypothetical protein D3C84_359620 [compost metagenome]